MLNSSGWREYATVPGDPAQLAAPALRDDVAWMGALGMTGITAWTAVRRELAFRLRAGAYGR